MQTVKNFFASVARRWRSLRPLWKGVIIVVLLIIIITIVKKSGPDTTKTIETVQTQSIVRTVAASGSVVSSTDLSLSFESAKIVSTIAVKVGDTVKAGQILATQKSGSERASYNAARGTLLAAEARYQKVLDGSSNEEIALAQVQLANAKKTQDNLVANARRKLYSDDLIADPQSSDILHAPTITGTYNGGEEGEYRLSFDNYNKSDIRYTGLEKGIADVKKLPQPFGTRGLRIAFPDVPYSADDSWKILIPNKSGANYTANLNAYQEALENRDAIISEKQAELDLKRATARQPEIDTALADIVSARAQVEEATAILEKNILRAPANGTITKVDTKIGELPSIDKEVIVLQDISNLYLEADVNESNVALLMLGQTVSVTFDALGNTVYNATISSIDPAATVTDGIVNYKVKALLTASENIRPGMTANMVVTTAEKSNVIAIPGRFITQKNGVSTVEVITDNRRGTTEVRTVTTGLRGDGDMVEIISGLTPGESILWSTVK